MSHPPFFWKSYEQYVGSCKNVHIKLTQQNTNMKFAIPPSLQMEVP
jgi:hypothetical protein